MTYLGVRPWLERDLQRVQAAKSEIVSPNLRLVRFQIQVWQSPQQGFKSDLSFDAGQRRAEAKMSSPPEGHVAVIRSGQI